MSEFFSNHSTAIIFLSSQITSLNDMVSNNFMGLEMGFDRLGAVLDNTEERILSWSNDNRIWMTAGFVGFVIGTLTGLTRWVMFGIATSMVTQSRVYWSSGDHSNSNSPFVCRRSCFHGSGIRKFPDNSPLSSSISSLRSL